jgi:hypothetical protein
MSQKTHPKSEDLGSTIDAVNTLVDQVTALVGPAPALSAADVRRSAKLRKGAEKVIPTIAALSEQFGLSLPSHPTSVVLTKLNQVQSLAPLRQKMSVALKQIDDVIFAAGSESWTGATVHYTTLKRLAKTNGDLEASLAPVREFFKQRSADVVAEEKQTKAARKAAKTAIAAAKANAALTKVQSAPAPTAPVKPVTPPAVPTT